MKFFNALGIILIIFAFSAIPCLGVTIIVPTDSSCIQCGINGAVAGDTVLVEPGTYYENIIVNSNIFVRSREGFEVTIINGNGIGSCVTFGNSVTNDCILEGFELTNGNNYGVDLTNGRPLIRDCRFQNNSSFPVFNAYPQEVGYYAANNVFVASSDGRFNALFTRMGIISDSTVWPILPSGFVYYLGGGDYSVRVEGSNNPELLIESGVIVKLAPPYYASYHNDDARFFQIGVSDTGSISAQGVYFTAATDDDLGGDTDGDGYNLPTGAYWSSLYLGPYSGESLLNGCYFRYGGNPNNNGYNLPSIGAAIYNLNGTPTITNCEFTNGYRAVRSDGGDPIITGNNIIGCTNYAMWLDIPIIDHHITGNTITNGSYFQARLDPLAVEHFVTGNTLLLNLGGQYNAVMIEQGIIGSNTTWPVLPYGIVYYVTGGDYTVMVEGADNPELYIEPGVIVKLDQPIYASYHNDDPRFLYIGLNEPGRLRAQGVYFTAFTDDDLGGDTNGDGYNPPSGPYWTSLYFASNSGGSLLDGCFIYYGGNPNNNGYDLPKKESAVYIENGAPTITNCEFVGCYTPIRVSGGNPNITNNNIMGSGRYGMWLDMPVITHNVSGNTISYGSYFLARLDPMAVEYFVNNNTVNPNLSGTYNAFYIEPGVISSSTTWPEPTSGIVYYLTGADYMISVEGASIPIWTIDSGSIVKLEPPYYASYHNDDPRFILVGVNGSGRLMAHGVSFTAASDDNLGGDSNGDGYSPPTSPYWSTLYFGSASGGSVLDACNFRYGGNPNNNGYDLPKKEAAIYIENSNPTINNCEFFGCYTAIRVEGGNPAITDNTMEQCSHHGIWLNVPMINHLVSGNELLNGTYMQARLHPMAVQQFVQNNTIGLNSNNMLNAILLESGTISSSTTWPVLPEGVVYYVTGGDYTIRVGGGLNPLLTIETGTIVKFDPPYYASYHNDDPRFFEVGTSGSGRMYAQGVYFTAATDDDLGGDSNGDGYFPPSGPYWSSVVFGPLSGGSTLDSCFIHYGGNPNNNGYGLPNKGAAIYVHNNSNLSISRCEFAYNYNGVRIAGAHPTIELSTFYTNVNGIQADSNSLPAISHNAFINNTGSGVINTSTTYIVDAINNYWGHNSGPHDASIIEPDYNPWGQGDSISDYVEYRPWLLDPNTDNRTLLNQAVVRLRTAYREYMDRMADGIIETFDYQKEILKSGQYENGLNFFNGLASSYAVGEADILTHLPSVLEGAEGAGLSLAADGVGTIASLTVWAAADAGLYQTYQIVMDYFNSDLPTEEEFRQSNFVYFSETDQAKSINQILEDFDNQYLDIIPENIPDDYPILEVIYNLDYISSQLEAATLQDVQHPPSRGGCVTWRVPGICDINDYVEMSAGSVNAYLSNVKSQYGQILSTKLASREISKACMAISTLKVLGMLIAPAAPAATLVVGIGDQIVCGFGQFAIKKINIDQQMELAYTLNDFMQFWPVYYASNWEFYSKIMTDVQGSLNGTIPLDCSSYFAPTASINLPSSICIPMGQVMEYATGNIQVENLSPDKSAYAQAFGKVYTAKSYTKDPVNAKVVSYVRGDRIEIPPASSANVPVLFELPSSIWAFGHSHFIVESKVITTGRELWPPLFQIESQAPPTCVIKDAFTNLGNLFQDIIHGGQTIWGSFTSSENSIRSIFSLRFEGSDIDLHIYDADSNHVGKNYETGLIDLEIPGAEYLGDSTNHEMIIINTNPNSQYSIAAVAVDVSGSVVGEEYEHISVDYCEEIGIDPDLETWPSTITVDMYPGDTATTSGEIFDRSGQHAIVLDSIVLDSIFVSENDSLETDEWILTCDLQSPIDSSVFFELSIIAPDSVAFEKYIGNITVFSQTDTITIELEVSLLNSFPDISGRIIYNDMIRSIGNVQVTLTGDTTITDSTDENGQFVFEDIPSGDYSVTPILQSNDAGVSVADIIKIRRHLAHLEDLESPYRVIAADVNDDDRVSVADVIKIRRYLAALDTLPVGNWRFFDATYLIDDTNLWVAPESIGCSVVSDNLYDVNFVGVRVGDVNNSWTPGGKTISKYTTGVVRNLKICSADGGPGDTVSLPVIIEKDTKFAGVELHIRFDSNNLKFNGIATDLIGDPTISNSGDYIHFVWENIDHAVDTQDNYTIAVLQFGILKEFKGQTDIEISRAEIADYYGNSYSLYFSNGSIKEGKDIPENVVLPEEYELKQNQPNPFNPITELKFSLPEAAEVQLDIFNVMGQRVKTLVNQHLEAGYHSCVWDAGDFASGIYFARLRANKFIDTKKMVLLK